MTVVCIAVLAGCGGSGQTAAEQTTTTTSAPEAVTCPNATPTVVKNIELGRTHGGSLRGAKSLTVPAGERNSQGWPQILVAARIHGQLALWATSVNADDAIWAINDPAREFTEWGTPHSREAQLVTQWTRSSMAPPRSHWLSASRDPEWAVARELGDAAFTRAGNIRSWHCRRSS
jgi:hypothetical protein